MKKETESLLEKIKLDLKESLTEKRYNHSVSVMNKAVELAKVYGEDEDDAAIAGILHDIAKEKSFDESMEIAEKNGVIIDDIEKINKKLIHGKIGAALAKEKYNVSTRIQRAIEYHTETNCNMDLLAKIVFVADKIEDTRKADENGIQEEREMSKIDIDKTIILIIDGTIRKLLDKGKLIHPEELVTRNKLIMDIMKKEELDNKKE